MKCTPILLNRPTYNTCTKIKLQTRPYFLDFFTCILQAYSVSGTSLECPAVVVSQHCSGPFSIVGIFVSSLRYIYKNVHRVHNYYNHTTVVREEIQMGMNKVDLRIHKNTLFIICFAESRECFMQVSKSCAKSGPRLSRSSSSDLQFDVKGGSRNLSAHQSQVLDILLSNCYILSASPFLPQVVQFLTRPSRSDTCKKYVFCISLLQSHLKVSRVDKN